MELKRQTKNEWWIEYKKRQWKELRNAEKKGKEIERMIIILPSLSSDENIELNSSLVKLLIEKDELYMEQDSRLVDIEDLTKFL